MLYDDVVGLGWGRLQERRVGPGFCRLSRLRRRRDGLAAMVMRFAVTTLRSVGVKGANLVHHRLGHVWLCSSGAGRLISCKLNEPMHSTN